MSDSAICLKSINDLLGERFFVPAYQRGYRWTEQQVVDLLEDVISFQPGKEGFYCLQPVVVKRLVEGGQWEIVDGQQRITTVFLILQYFNLRFTESFRKKLYNIEYETRTGSAEYLTTLNPEKSDDNIDFYFMYQASRTIEEWFEDKANQVNDFESALLNRVKVIWYELPDGDSAVDAFTRLNVGKIPLTSAELVRALFLRSTNFPHSTAIEQLKIAQEWDLMEKALQDDDFWYFLINRQDRPNRIEFLFDLITATDEGGRIQVADPYASFHHFDELLSIEGNSSDLVWNEVKQYFMTLEEWYHDDKLFHLIGFLINEGDNVLELIALSKSSAKREFRSILKRRILKKSFFIPDGKVYSTDELASHLEKTLSELEYDTRPHKIKSILLLFNIASIIANDKSIVRFRFDYFKKENWDIEHIRSVESGRPTANIDKRPWLETVRDYFAETGDCQDLREAIQKMLDLQSYTTGDAFDILYDSALAHFGEQDSSEVENGIGNLALLDSRTNRGYKNAVFPIKRRKLLQYDQEGTFVPLCTRNAFLKCYSQNVENMFFWGDSDMLDYRQSIVRMLTDFFAK